MKKDFDVIIIGAGSAGLSAMKQVKKDTNNFALINHGPLGTTCARVGCMPSKVLIEAANAYHNRKKFKEFGIHGAEGLQVNGKEVLARVRKLRDFFVSSTLKATDNLGEKFIEGKARLISENEVEVNSEKLRAKSVIIATGSSPIVPPEWKNLSRQIISSDELFELELLPETMAVVGLGAIGLEMAQALARLGVRVSAFSHGSQLAGLSDPKVNERLKTKMATEMDLHLGEEVSISADDAGTITLKAGSKEVKTKHCLVAIGRRANLDGLGLDKLGIALDAKGLPVDYDPKSTQVANLPIFIAGDASLYRPLLHEAADSGHIAGINAVTKTPHCFKRRTPIGIVFSDPNVAVVGQAYSEVADCLIGEVDFANQGRARAAQKNYGLMRIYAAKDTAKILGAEICAPAAEHMAHLLALAIQENLSVFELLQMPFYHPVLEEGLRTALRDIASQHPANPRFNLSFCKTPGFQDLE